VGKAVEIPVSAEQESVKALLDQPLRPRDKQAEQIAARVAYMPMPEKRAGLVICHGNSIPLFHKYINAIIY
jgi:hypothetical protein